jgi:cytochrome c-type biogenesis protein CcmH
MPLNEPHPSNPYLLFILLLLGLALIAPLSSGATPPPGDQDPVLEQRLRALEEELRCLVCQNQTLADSPSEWADGMRGEIRGMLKKGMSNDEVVDFLITRYGDFVTYQPPFKPTTYILWLGPIVLLVMSIGLLVFVVRRRSAGQAPPPLSEQDREEAEKILGLKGKSS